MAEAIGKVETLEGGSGEGGEGEGGEGALGLLDDEEMEDVLDEILPPGEGGEGGAKGRGAKGTDEDDSPAPIPAANPTPAIRQPRTRKAPTLLTQNWTNNRAINRGASSPKAIKKTASRRASPSPGRPKVSRRGGG